MPSGTGGSQYDWLEQLNYGSVGVPLAQQYEFALLAALYGRSRRERLRFMDMLGLELEGLRVAHAARKGRERSA